MLTITKESISSVPVFRLNGNLDALGVGAFDQDVIEASRGDRFIVLEFSMLHFLSSAGIRKIIELGKGLQKAGGKLYLSAMNEQVVQVLKISGLLHQFAITRTAEEAVMGISRIARDGHSGKEYRVDGRAYSLARLEQGLAVLKTHDAGSSVDKQLLSISASELGFGLGEACFADNRENAARVMAQPFLSLPGFFGFLENGREGQSDFLRGGEGMLQGVYVKRYLGTKAFPQARVVFESDGTECTVLFDDLLSMGMELLREPPAVMGICGYAEVETETEGVQPSCLAAWLIDRQEFTREQAFAKSRPLGLLHDSPDDTIVHYRSFPVNKLAGEPVFQDFLDHLWQKNPPEPRLSVAPQGKIRSAVLWLFLPQESADLNADLLQIESPAGATIPDSWELMIRRIYRGSSRISLQPLQGGFSATTYLVDSYDAQGRKRLPTVLKLGQQALIKREEQRYTEFVQPFILNNSVSVLGANYYQGQGAICYNFLGVDGPESKLQWLRHVYLDKPAEILNPLFDRIFKEILKPWYGQPRWEQLALFKEHSPLFPFFPNVVEDAYKILGINAEEKYLECPPLGRQVLNPYWYLKHVWPKRENEVFPCYTAVCHGDLNMQNILIDEKQNIYIIDFSETQQKNAVSDFARLEPIFKIEMTRDQGEEDLALKLEFEQAILQMDTLGQVPPFVYRGDDPQVRKAYEMVCRLRAYARQVSIFEEDPLPYWLAVLEWTLPYVSYRGMDNRLRWHAAFSAGLICERLYR